MNLIQFINRKLFGKVSAPGLVFLLFFLGTSTILAENYTNLLSQADKKFKQKNYKQALKYCNEAILLDVSNFLGYAKRGSLYLQTKKYDKAQKDFNEGVRLATNSFQLGYAYLYRGYFYHQTTNYEKAVDDYSKAIQIDGPSAAAYLDRAGSYISEGRYDPAIIDCNMAILLNPTKPEAFGAKGFAYQSKKEFDKAIEAYSKAINLDTNYIATYMARAACYVEKDDYANAIADYSRVVQLDKTNAVAYAVRGLCHSREGDFKRGIEDCQKGEQIDKNCFIAHNNLAWLLAIAPQAELRDGKKAVKHATRACELTSWKEAYCLGTLAAGYAEIGKFDEAIKWEQKCIQIGLPKEKEMLQARKELDLFKQKKPYHAEK
jgi:tetratricopeptide (TPR) repeat protein